MPFAIVLNVLNNRYVKNNIVFTKTKDTFYPTQYSDTHITKNATISDARFNKTVTLEKKNFWSGFLANIVSSLEKPQVTPSKGLENGTWLWTPIPQITPEYRNTIIVDAKKHGITNIYLSIDSYLDIYTMENGPEKDNLRNNFDETVLEFVTEAHKNNITVDAEAGWRNWAEVGHAYKAFATIQYAIEFNKTHKEKFRGFQYDVEPYLLDEYQKGDKAGVLGNFVNLVDETVEWLKESDLQLSVVIPEFYDGTNLETPKFFYAGTNTYAINHLLNILDRRPESKIIIMSYRNWSLGDDSTVDISKNEVIAANNRKTKIIIAQETGDVKPSYITFYNTSKQYYKRQVTSVQIALSGNKSFGGMATHYVNSYLELR
jgi:hypothetical protein